MLPGAPDDDTGRARRLDMRRLELNERPDCSFVAPDEFIRLLTCTMNLVRADEGPIGLRGLLDVEKNRRFLIEERELYSGGDSVPPQF